MSTSITEVVAPYSQFKPADAGAEALLNQIHGIVETDHATHPFSKDTINKDNAIRVMGQYFAMSQAFPYLQVHSVFFFPYDPPCDAVFPCRLV